MTKDEAREFANQFGSRMCDENGETHGEELYCFSLDDIIAFNEALAQRTWVGLTEQQRNDIEDACEMIIGKPVFDAVEAKLKKKNT
jgi:hypothetical protein